MSYHGLELLEQIIIIVKASASIATNQMTYGTLSRPKTVYIGRLRN